MAATLDDLLFAAAEQKTELKGYLDKFEEHFRKLLDEISYGFAALRVDLRGLRGAAPPVPPPTPTPPGATAGKTGAAVWEGMTAGSARVLALFAALERGITAFGASVAKFVSQASPAHIIRWNLAVADLQAVIGRALIPVMEMATAMVRKMGDAVASLSGEATKLSVGLGLGAGLGGVVAGLLAAVRPLIAVVGGIPLLIGTLVGAFVGVAAQMQGGKAIMSAFGSVVKSVMAVVEVAAAVLVPVLETLLVPALEAAAAVVKDLAEVLMDFVNGVREMIGLESLKGKEKSSTGAAVRRAEIGDIQSYINRAYTSAYQSAGGSQSDPAKESLGVLKDIREILRKSSPLLTPSDASFSTRPGLEWIDRSIGGDGSTGRRIGGLADATAAPFTAVPRLAVETLRTLFG